VTGVKAGTVVITVTTPQTTNYLKGTKTVSLLVIPEKPGQCRFVKWQKSNYSKCLIAWNIIYGCNGYNVFVTTNPSGTWYWNQSTDISARSTSATISKYRGSKLKKGKTYYVRIVTRRKRNGVFCTVPMPAANTYIGTFRF